MKTNNPVKIIKYFIKTRLIYFRGNLSSIKVTNFKEIPIIINNYNRLTTLKSLINSLEVRGYNNIFILDNASTYEPLLEYYKTTKATVIMLGKNIGHKSLWRTNCYKIFYSSYYAYTDSDVVPCEACPDDFIEYFWNILQRHKYATKAGFGLRIDDIPEYYNEKKLVLDWESRYWKQEVEPDVYRAPIDTTFALYRPFSKSGANWYLKHYRTGGRYVARHLPWYNDSSNLSQEEQYYHNSCLKPTHWSKLWTKP